MTPRLIPFLACLSLLLLTHCGKPADPPEKMPAPAAAKPAATTPADPASTASTPKKVYWSDEMLHTEIKYHNPNYQGDGQFEIREGEPLALILRGTQVQNLRFIEKLQPLMLDLSSTPITDLGPLRGKPVVELYLEDTQATDLSALRGMPLRKLYLSRTPARDLSALENMPLEELNVIHSNVADISALATCKNLSMLWLTDCPVENIAALQHPPLVSVTLHRTKVKDLSPLSGTRLQRLHIGETPVTDLTPASRAQPHPPRLHPRQHHRRPRGRPRTPAARDRHPLRRRITRPRPTRCVLGKACRPSAAPTTRPPCSQRACPSTFPRSATVVFQFLTVLFSFLLPS
jgi:internalin A